MSTLTKEKKLNVQYLSHLNQWLQEGLQLRSNIFQVSYQYSIMTSNGAESKSNINMSYLNVNIFVHLLCIFFKNNAKYIHKLHLSIIHFVDFLEKEKLVFRVSDKIRLNSTCLAAESHKFEKYLNIEGFPEKFLKIQSVSALKSPYIIESVLKSAGKWLLGLEKYLNFAIFGKL